MLAHANIDNDIFKSSNGKIMILKIKKYRIKKKKKEIKSRKENIKVFHLYEII